MTVQPIQELAALAAPTQKTDWSRRDVIVPPQVVLHAALWRIEHAAGHVFEACDLIRITWPTLVPYRDIIESNIRQVIAIGGLPHADKSMLHQLLAFMARPDAPTLAVVAP